MRKSLLAASALFALAAPAQAGIVFSDNFDSENGGASQFNYAGFANFNVVGQVDIIAHQSFFSCPGPGSCVDLDGTSGPGKLVSKGSFAFNAGDKVRLSFDLSGNQRTGGSDGFFAGFSFGGATQLLNYGFNYFGADTIVIPNTVTTGLGTSSSIAANAPFAQRSIFFTAGQAGTLSFEIGSGSADNFGPVMDNVLLDVTAAIPEPASWGLMIAGFGLAGAALRTRRRSAVLA